jgi:hypothetical protein
MFSTELATTRNLTLAEVTERLGRNAGVHALVTIGSTRNALQPAYSDYDLVIVLEAWPVEVRVGYTTIDGKLTDLLFVESAAITRILAQSQHSRHEVQSSVERASSPEHVAS